MFKIVKGTPGSKSICNGCRFYRHRMLESGEEIRMCSQSYDYHIPITKVIVDCNDFEESNRPSLYDMRQQAWFLKTNASGQALGFMPRKDFVDKYGEDEADKV